MSTVRHHLLSQAYAEHSREVALLGGDLSYTLEDVKAFFKYRRNLSKELILSHMRNPSFISQLAERRINTPAAAATAEALPPVVNQPIKRSANAPPPFFDRRMYPFTRIYPSLGRARPVQEQDPESTSDISEGETNVDIDDDVRRAIAESIKTHDLETRRRTLPAVVCCICDISLYEESQKCKFSHTCDHYTCVECFVSTVKFELEGGGVGGVVNCPACKSEKDKSLAGTVIPQSAAKLADPRMLVVNFEKAIAASVKDARRYQTLYFQFSPQLGPFLSSTVSSSSCDHKRCPLCKTYTFSMARLPGKGEHVCRCPNIRCAALVCLKCELPAHMGSECSQAKLEDAKSKDRATEELIDHSTQQCPRCRARVTHFRNHKCHHMTCTCGHQFCYCCLQPWNGSHTGEFGKYCPMFCRDGMCKCPVCPTCKPGKPCEDCTGCSACSVV